MINTERDQRREVRSGERARRIEEAKQTTGRQVRFTGKRRVKSKEMQR